MKKYIKTIGILLISITLTQFVGCNEKSPTQVTTEYIDIIKSGSDNNLLKSILSSNFDSTSVDEGEKEIINKMYSKYANMTYKINSEVINGDEATVNITANVPDMNTVITGTIQEVLSKALEGVFSSQEFTEEDQNKAFVEAFDNSLNSIAYVDNTADIILVKKDNTWQIKDVNDIEKLLINVDIEALENLDIK